MEVTQRVRKHCISSRSHLQGAPGPLRLRLSARTLTDGASLVLLRRLWNRLDMGSWLDQRTAEVLGRYRPSMMVEVWMAPLLYGGGWMDNLKLVAARGVCRLFVWEAVPDPPTFSRWFRRIAPVLVPVLDELVQWLVRARWTEPGDPEQVAPALDSTVRVRYGENQAGAELGYYPKKPRRPSHRSLLAFLVETGDCLGVRRRPGSAWSTTGAVEWLPELVGRLRVAGVERITVRLDKGSFSKRVVRSLQRLMVSYLLNVPSHAGGPATAYPWGRPSRAEGIFEASESVWTSSGRLWGGRLLAPEDRRPLAEAPSTVRDPHPCAVGRLADSHSGSAPELAVPATRPLYRSGPQVLPPDARRRAAPGAASPVPPAPHPATGSTSAAAG